MLGMRWVTVPAAQGRMWCCGYDCGCGCGCGVGRSPGINSREQVVSLDAVRPSDTLQIFDNFPKIHTLGSRIHLTLYLTHTLCCVEVKQASNNFYCFTTPQFSYRHRKWMTGRCVYFPGRLQK